MLPWFGRPVSAANKSGNDTAATRQVLAHSRTLWGSGRYLKSRLAMRQWTPLISLTTWVTSKSAAQLK